MKLLTIMVCFCVNVRAFFVPHLLSGNCRTPAPATGFTNQRYTGLWYEIGKIQTSGGAFFEKDCVCTTIDVHQLPGSTDYTAINSCRKLTPTGSFLNATGISATNYLIDSNRAATILGWYSVLDPKSCPAQLQVQDRGSSIVRDSTLSDEGPAGHWKEGFFPLAPKADYTIIYLDDNYSIEYDCSSLFGSTNYCIHILSRTPTADDTMVKKLVAFATGLDLNTENLEYKQTLQQGCW